MTKEPSLLLAALFIFAAPSAAESPGALETRLSWKSGAEVFVFTRGPLAEQRRDPLCVRAVRPGLDLERLYRSLEPRLNRP